jgi:hypothetical protein
MGNFHYSLVLKRSSPAFRPSTPPQSPNGPGRLSPHAFTGAACARSHSPDTPPPCTLLVERLLRCSSLSYPVGTGSAATLLTIDPNTRRAARLQAPRPSPAVKCPRIMSTDLNGLRLLAEWHEVKLQYTAVSMPCVVLSMVGVVASKLGPPCDGVGCDLLRSRCQKAPLGTNPANSR